MSFQNGGEELTPLSDGELEWTGAGNGDNRGYVKKAEPYRYYFKRTCEVCSIISNPALGGGNSGGNINKGYSGKHINSYKVISPRGILT